MIEIRGRRNDLRTLDESTIRGTRYAPSRLLDFVGPSFTMINKQAAGFRTLQSGHFQLATGVVAYISAPTNL